MNKETLEIFGKLLSGGKQIVLGKPRQIGSTNLKLHRWKILHEKYERAQKRKETISNLFNI